jgi:hypothetical protein
VLVVEISSGQIGDYVVKNRSIREYRETSVREWIDRMWLCKEVDR